MRGSRHNDASLWGFVGLLGFVSLLLWVEVIPPELARSSQPVAGLIILLAAFVIAEWSPLTLEFKGDTMNLTLSGVLTLVGLFFVGPLPTLAARLVSAFFVLLVRWQNPPAKLAVNISAMSLEVWVVGTLVGGLMQAPEISTPKGWAVVLLAALAGEAVMSLCVLVAMRITIGPLQGESAAALGYGVLASISMGWVYSVMSVTLLEVDLRLGAIIGLGLALLIISNRQRHNLRLRYRSLRSLYRFMIRVDEADDTPGMVSRILDEATAVVGAEHAALLMVDQGRTTCMSNEHGQFEVSWVSRQPVEWLIQYVGTSRVLPPGTVPSAAHELLNPRAPAIAASLGHADLTGVLLLTGRPVALPDFDAQDLELATAVARHAGAALAEARLFDRLREERIRIEQMGLTDRLTGLRNREGLLRDVPTVTTGAVVVVGMRDLAAVTTGLGHAVGERLIRDAARRLREVAEGGGMVTAAYGDGQFALIAPDVLTMADGTAVCRQVIWGMSGPVDDGTLPIEISPVVGIAMAPVHGTDTAELIRAADKAMQQAMERGLSEAWFDSDYDRRSVDRLQLASELRRALDEGHITVAFQPKVDLESGVVVGVEALARWPHATRGFIEPSEFVDVAERTGLIRPLTLLITQLTLAAADEWRLQGLDLAVSFNLSIAVMSDPSVARQIVSLIRAHATPPERVVIEITESQLLDETDRGSGALAIFGAAGIGLSVDDFGTGYSSLAQVKHLPVQELKVDRSFVTDMTGSQTDQVIVASVVRLAHELGLTVVAEGIEDDETRQRLLELGCDQAQGYHFSVAVPSTHVPAVIQAIEAAHGPQAPNRPMRLRPRRADEVG